MTKKKGVIEAAADAAVEIGMAAASLKKSFEHVRKAEVRGRPATKAIVRSAKSTYRAAARSAKGAVKKITRKK